MTLSQNSPHTVVGFLQRFFIVYQSIAVFAIFVRSNCMYLRTCAKRIVPTNHTSAKCHVCGRSANLINYYNSANLRICGIYLWTAHLCYLFIKMHTQSSISYLSFVFTVMCVCQVVGAFRFLNIHVLYMNINCTVPRKIPCASGHEPHHRPSLLPCSWNCLSYPSYLNKYIKGTIATIN